MNKTIFLICHFQLFYHQIFSTYAEIAFMILYYKYNRMRTFVW